MKRSPIEIVFSVVFRVKMAMKRNIFSWEWAPYPKRVPPKNQTNIGQRSYYVLHAWKGRQCPNPLPSTLSLKNRSRLLWQYAFVMHLRKMGRWYVSLSWRFTKARWKLCYLLGKMAMWQCLKSVLIVGIRYEGSSLADFLLKNVFVVVSYKSNKKCELSMTFMSMVYLFLGYVRSQ